MKSLVAHEASLQNQGYCGRSTLVMVEIENNEPNETSNDLLMAHTPHLPPTSKHRSSIPRMSQHTPVCTCKRTATDVETLTVRSVV